MRKLLIFILFLLIGCASTNISSYKDPEPTKTKFNKIMVLAGISEVGNRQYLENKVSEELNKHGISAYPSINYFPPTRVFTKDQFAEVVVKNNFDGILTLTLTGKETKQKSYTTTKLNIHEYLHRNNKK